jgi:hypothetical protein
MIEKIWCSSCPHPCYFEIRYSIGDPKTQSFLRCPLGFSPNFITADKSTGDIQILNADRQPPPAPAPARSGRPASLEDTQLLSEFSDGGPGYGNAARQGNP